MDRFVSRDDMVSFRSTRSYDTNLLVPIRGGQSNKKMYEGKSDGSWKRIRGIAGSFVWYETIINGYGREIQIWITTIN